MAVTIAEQALVPLPELRSTDLRYAVKQVTFDASYLTGGEPVTAQQFGMTKIRYGFANIRNTSAVVGCEVVQCVVKPQTDGSALLRLNKAAAEVANAIDASAIVVNLILFGDA